MEKEALLASIKSLIRNIPDFPKLGILFRDITPLLGNGALFSKALDMMLLGYDRRSVDAIVGVDSRGFIFGGAAAARMELPFIPIRKKGKLPWRTYEETFALEYGADTLAVHQDAFKPGWRVLIVDDLLATGGTAGAAINLVRRTGASVVGCSFLIELVDLKGKSKLGDVPMFSLIQY